MSHNIFFWTTIIAMAVFSQPTFACEQLSFEGALEGLTSLDRPELLGAGSFGTQQMFEHRLITFYHDVDSSKTGILLGSAVPTVKFGGLFTPVFVPSLPLVPKSLRGVDVSPGKPHLPGKARPGRRDGESEVIILRETEWVQITNAFNRETVDMDSTQASQHSESREYLDFLHTHIAQDDSLDLIVFMNNFEPDTHAFWVNIFSQVRKLAQMEQRFEPGSMPSFRIAIIDTNTSRPGYVDYEFIIQALMAVKTLGIEIQFPTYTSRVTREGLRANSGQNVAGHPGWNIMSPDTLRVFDSSDTDLQRHFITHFLRVTE